MSDPTQTDPLLERALDSAPPTTAPAPRGEMPVVVRVPRPPLTNPDASAAQLAAEVERLRATMDAVEERHDEKAREEHLQREQEERNRRELVLLDTQTEAALGAVVAQLRELLPGAERLAAAVEEVEAKYLARAYTLGAGRGQTTSKLYRHPVYRLKPLLDLLRSESADPGERDPWIFRRDSADITSGAAEGAPAAADE